MVCYGTNKRIKGSGMLDNLMKPFTYEKYLGERHGYSLNPKTFLQPFSYCGPGTAILTREKLGDTKVVDDLDQYAKDHDYTYFREKSEYEKDHDKQKHMKNIWKADDQFIEKAKNSKDEPIMGPLASKLIATKEVAEKLGAPTTFTGFGADQESESTDPVARLRSLVQQQYKSDAKNDKKKIQRGGIAPILIPIGVAIASALGSKAISDIYDWVKSKVTGSGVKVPYHKTKAQRIQFLKEVVNNLN